MVLCVYYLAMTLSCSAMIEVNFNVHATGSWPRIFLFNRM